MTLEEYRLAEGLSYAKLAERFGLSCPSLARRYALGARMPEADIVERICEATGRKVTPEDFHRVRLAHVRGSAP